MSTTTTFPHLHRCRRIAKIVASCTIIAVALHNLEAQRSWLDDAWVQTPTQELSHRKTRVLWGFFSGDFKGEEIYRNKLRLLFSMVPDKICSLDRFVTDHTGTLQDSCELIYTFVAGALKEGPTERLEGCDNMTLTAPASDEQHVSPDFGSADITLLNIK